MQAGLHGEKLLAVVDSIERDNKPKRSSNAERQARFRAKKAANGVTNNVTSNVTDNVTGNVTSNALAHVRDITSNSENNHILGGGVGDARECDADDWPTGSASQHARLIVAEVASPWLDPSKSPGLVTTEGRFVAWRRDGASWEHDVLPVIRGAMVRMRKPVASWKWFDDAIGRSIADNRQALTIPEAGAVIPFRHSTGPPSLTERIEAEHQLARDMAFKLMENGN